LKTIGGVRNLDFIKISSYIAFLEEPSSPESEVLMFKAILRGAGLAGPDGLGQLWTKAQTALSPKSHNPPSGKGRRVIK
jgi:hypothetical protein